MVAPPSQSDKRPSITNEVLLADSSGDKILLAGGADNITLNPQPSGDAAPDTGFTSLKTYSGDGATDEFDVPFPANTPDDYTVSVYNTSTNLWEIQELDVDYWVPTGGRSIVFFTSSVPATADDNVEIRRHSRRDVYPTVKLGRDHRIHPEALSAPTFLAQEIEDQQVDGVFQFYGRNWVNAITTCPIYHHYTMSTSTIHMPVHEPLTFTRVSCVSWHTDTSPPSDWWFGFVMRIAAGSTQYTRGIFQLDLGTNGRSEVTHGQWVETTSPFNPVSIDVDPGQMFYVQLTGSALDKIHLNLTLGYRRRNA
jgi:hypothetical protein